MQVLEFIYLKKKKNQDMGVDCWVGVGGCCSCIQNFCIEFSTRNKHVKYENPFSFDSKVMAKVKSFQK